MDLSPQMIGYLEVALDCMKQRMQMVRPENRTRYTGNKKVHDAIPQVERIIEMLKQQSEQYNS